MKGAEKPLRRGRLVSVNKHTDTDLQKSQYISICSAKAVTSFGGGGSPTGQQQDVNQGNLPGEGEVWADHRQAEWLVITVVW